MTTGRDIFFRNMGLPSRQPMAIEISHAEGIYLFGSDGRKYIDLVSGVSVSNIGHRHPAVVKAIHDQTGRHLHLMVYGEIIQKPQVELAELLTGNLPGNLDCVYFVNSGSEAIEGALKLAKRYTGRTGIVAFKNAYHGGTCGALSILGNESLKAAFRPLLPGITHIEFNRVEELERITQKTACVVAETIQAEAGIILPETGFLEALREKCDETGALLIIDDVQMGFGRTGKLFSFENYGIVPDILALAKGMGGGMPIGAFISSKEIMNSLTFKPELGHITTFGGHPVCCAAAHACLKTILDLQLAPEAEVKGRIFEKSLEKHPAVKEIRRAGLMLAIELTDEGFAAGAQKRLLDNHIITDRFLFRPGAFRIAPPLTINEDEIGEALQGIYASLMEI
ncbi:MAG: aspartate aminotransferase family protein [Bacteroidales bacterium]|nr:aspartate aminotransferase family protein [Bacteroidales bacterium]